MSSLPSGIQGSTTCLAHWENVRTVLELYLYRPDATIRPWEHLATLPTDRIVLGNWESTSMATWLCRKILVPDVCQSLTCFTHASEAETFHRRCQQWRIPTPSRADSLTLTTRCGNVKLSCFVCSDGCKYFILPLTQRPRQMTVESVWSANSCEKQSPNVTVWDVHHRKLWKKKDSPESRNPPKMSDYLECNGKNEGLTIKSYLTQAIESMGYCYSTY